MSEDTMRDQVNDSCFVMMPFEAPYEEYYQEIVVPAIQAVNLRSVRADEIYGTRPIIADIAEQIHCASVCVAEFTTRNPNVMYELGLAHTLGVPVVMLSQSTSDIPFDVRHLRIIEYDPRRTGWDGKLREKLVATLRHVLADPASQTALPGLVARASSTSVKLREEYYAEIVGQIRKATTEITFVDGISSWFLNRTFYSALAERLAQSPALIATFIYQSEDSLFRRCQYHARAADPKDHVTYASALIRKRDTDMLRERILAHVPPASRQRVSAQVRLEECHLQLFMVVTKVDDTIFLSPASHRRHSRSTCRMLTDPRAEEYRLANDYIDFLRDGRNGAAYCTPADPSDDLLPVFDARGIQRSYARRSTFDRVALPTRVVWGFVIDSSGHVLIHRRSSAAYDNRMLWDKSFGGHFRIEPKPDDSAPYTALREFAEELMPANAAEKVNYRGEWDRKSASDLNQPSGRWFMVRIGSTRRRTSVRLLPSGKNIAPKLFVDCFIVFTPAPAELAESTSETESIKWIPAEDLRATVRNDAEEFTNDMSTIVGADEILGRLIEFSRWVRSIDPSSD